MNRSNKKRKAAGKPTSTRYERALGLKPVLGHALDDAMAAQEAAAPAFEADGVVVEIDPRSLGLPCDDAPARSLGTVAAVDREAGTVTIAAPATHAPTILAADGRPARLEATESEEATPATIHDFRLIVRQHWPLLEPKKAEAQAQAMLARHPIIDKAYRAGLKKGRDCRERLQRGLGLWWPELKELLPNERGFVVAKVREAVLGRA